MESSSNFRSEFDSRIRIGSSTTSTCFCRTTTEPYFFSFTVGDLLTFTYLQTRQTHNRWNGMVLRGVEGGAGPITLLEQPYFSV